MSTLASSGRNQREGGHESAGRRARSDRCAAAPVTAAPTPVGWRESMKSGPHDAQHFSLVQAGPPCSPLPGLSGAGQNQSRPSVTAGQPHLSSCLVDVHTKTALMPEPARTRGWQLSGAGTRVAGILALNTATAAQAPRWRRPSCPAGKAASRCLCSACWCRVLPGRGALRGVQA